MLVRFTPFKLAGVSQEFTSPAGIAERVAAALRRPEGRRLEFKHAERSFDKDKAASYCAALANEGGGELILGVDDSTRRVLGTSAFRDPAELERYLFEHLRTVVVRVHEATLDGRRVMLLDVPARPRGQAVLFRGRRFIRTGESLTDMPDSMLQEVFSERMDQLLLEGTGVRVRLKELDSHLALDELFAAMGRSRPGMDLADALIRLRLVRAVGDSDDLEITRLGAVAAATDLGRFDGLRHHAIRVLRYRGTSRLDVVSDRFFESGYVVAFTAAITHLKDLLPPSERITETLRVDVPAYSPLALREFLANALVHQDFEIDSTPVTVEVFDDRLEIRNPGLPLVPFERFVDVEQSRNPDLADLLRRARICEKRGSGVDRALEEIERLLKPAPTFSKKGRATVVTMRMKQEFADMSLGERAWTAFLHCCLLNESGQRMTNSTLRERFGLGQEKTALVSQTLAEAVRLNLIAKDPNLGASRRTAAYVPFFMVESEYDGVRA